MYICKYCERKFKNKGGYTTHHPYCKENPNRVQREKSPNAHRRKGSTPWNKGKTLDELVTEGKLKEESKNSMISGSIKGGSISSGKCLNEELELERRKKISEAMKNNPNCGGYRKGSGIGKSGWYKGFYCDSSWELAFVIYNLDHNIPFKRNKEKFEYIFEGKKRNFIPDFIMGNGEFLEIKGYKTEQWEAKLKQFNKPLIILYEKEIKKYLDYVYKKYGKNFIEVYEK